MTSRKPLSLMAFSVLLLTPMLAWAERLLHRSMSALENSSQTLPDPSWD